MKRHTLHETFEAALALKGANAVLEILGGFLLLAASPSRVDSVVHFLTQYELSQDPSDLVANFLVHAASSFSVSGQLFGIYYLFSHGLIKLFLVVALFRKKSWAYPGMMAFLILAILYQLYRIDIAFSVGITLLTAFDAVVLWLVWQEWRAVTGRVTSA